MKSLSQLTEADIAARLAAREVEPYIDPYRESFVSGDPRQAAVLIPLLRNQDNWEILFIRRTTVENDHHSGQVAFPGGRMDPEDASPEETALREAQEEIALPSEKVRVLGNLEYMVTISNFQVTPVVGVLPWPIALQAAPSEVQRIFTIPLEWLADSSNHELRERQMPGGTETHPVHYFEHFDNELLWGVSAHIMVNFLQAIGLD